MRTFDIKIRQSGRVVCFSALARCSVDAFLQALAHVTEGVSFGIVVMRADHGCQ